jgi:hypothetical protein
MTQPTASLSSTSGAGVGTAVATVAGTVVAGSIGVGGNGAAYVFVKPSGGWVSTTQPTATLTASDENSIDRFGSSVAISGATLVVGAPFHPSFAPGTAYVFIEPPGGWTDMTQTAELSVPTNVTLEFGTSVAVEGNVVLAGAPLAIIGANAQGSLYGYVKPSTGWANSNTPNGFVTASPGEAQEEFGSSVAVSGKTFVVGAPHDGDALQGAAYIFALQ